MAEGEDLTVRLGTHLSVGDYVEARHKGRLDHLGTVTDTHPVMGLFWIMGDLTGGRRLLDLAELEIVRFPDAFSKSTDAEATAA